MIFGFCAGVPDNFAQAAWSPVPRVMPLGWMLDLWGGAMATAKFAGEQGRLLFAVPGRIDQSTSSGTNQLIRDGATLLTKADDILQELQFLGGMRPMPVAERRGDAAAAGNSDS